MNLEKVSVRKIYLGFLALGLVAIALGFYQTGKNIHSPFSSYSSNNSSLSNEISDIDQKLLDLKNKDTDGDGLSDFDELYTYDTSPYLKDSDSDGLNDKDEIDQGKNPNCPEGETCTESSINANTNTGTNILNVNVSNTNTTATSNLSATELRQLLKNAGAPEDVLNNTDDATLLQLYQETIQENGASGLNLNLTDNTNVAGNTNSSTNNNTNGSQVTADYLQGLSAAEIRELLISSGADEATISQVDDATLKQIFIQAMQEEGLTQ